jgi:hypothetical protein
MAVIDDKTKELKVTKENGLQVKVENLIIMVRKKGSKKDYEWCIGLVNTFEIYRI